MKKIDMLNAGVELLERFCAANDIPAPILITDREDWPFSVCAFYRSGHIFINLKKCSGIGRGGPAWSYPGHLVDRTPYGVLQHELGHYVDVRLSEVKAPYYGSHSLKVMVESGEPGVTTYTHNHGEWWAEAFRVFVTNPDLLNRLRPRTFDLIHARLKPVELRSWREVLEDAPERTMSLCESRVIEAAQA